MTLAGAGSGARLLGSHASTFFKDESQKRAIGKAKLAKESQKFVNKLGELKGAYVKIGQMMALYGEHLLPREVTNALHELEHRTAPLAWPVIEQEIERALGSKQQELTIDENPLAAASLAQVHRARHKDSKQALCLKVQYPGVAGTIESDFKTVLQMLRFARWIPNGREFETWVHEIKQMLLDEVDYVREARMTILLADLLKEDDRFVVPTILSPLSTATVLSMSYESGFAVTDSEIQKLSQSRRNSLAEAMLELFFKEVFRWGVMQTDPNFGNYRIRLRQAADQNDKLVLLDFGAVRPLTSEFAIALQKTIVAAHLNNRFGVIEGAIEIGCLHPNQSEEVKQSFADFCILLMEPFKETHKDTPNFAVNKKGQYRWAQSRLLKRVGKVGAKAILQEGFTSPPKEFALIARKLTGVFTFIATLGAEFNAEKTIKPYL